jgi:predicted dehydrogenase
MSARLSGEQDRFERFCVVGYGNHAQTKLIPALIANGQEIAGLVTRRPNAEVGFPIFRHLEDALAALSTATAFVIATPPQLHHGLAAAAIEAGVDVFVEKPAFLRKRELVAAANSAERTGALLIEMFMHRHTELNRRLLDWWRNQGQSVMEIDIDFLIPAIPSGTFREEASIDSSCLYDIGCYPISLLCDLGLPLDFLAVSDVVHAGLPTREMVRLEGSLGQHKVRVQVGIWPEYRNVVSFRVHDHGTVTFSPFFYGRPGPRRIVSTADEVSSETAFEEGNAFQNMFGIGRKFWRDTQRRRIGAAIEVTATLERLAVELQMARLK